MQDLQETLARGLKIELDDTVDNGRPLYVYGDGAPQQIGISHVPDREWNRTYGNYKAVNTTLLTEQREHTKLAILANRSGESTLTDEEFADEMRQLEQESVRKLGVDELAAELERRGVRVVVPIETEDE